MFRLDRGASSCKESVLRLDHFYKGQDVVALDDLDPECSSSRFGKGLVRSPSSSIDESLESCTGWIRFAHKRHIGGLLDMIYQPGLEAAISCLLLTAPSIRRLFFSMR